MNRTEKNDKESSPEAAMEDTQAYGKDYVEVCVSLPPPAEQELELCKTSSRRILSKAFTAQSRIDTARQGSLVNIVYTKSDTMLSNTFDLQQMEDSITSGDSTRDNFRKYTGWFGTRFKDLQVELKFLNEHSVLNKRTVYAGYLFQIATALVFNLILFFEIASTDNSFICSRLPPSIIQSCESVLLPGGKVATRKLSLASICFSCSIVAIGIVIHWYIHQSNTITNKAWAMLAVWTNYLLNIVGYILLLDFLNANDVLWSLRIYLCFIGNILLAVWFTGLTFIQNILLFLISIPILYGVTVSRAYYAIYMTSQDIPPAAKNNYLLGYVIYTYSLMLPFIFGIIALASSYLNERTARMRFLQRLIITHQQNNVIKEKSYNEKMQRTFLENVLPASIVDKLQGDAFSMGSIEHLSQKHQGVSILFADIAGFTSFATQVDSATVMSFLNELFLHFDELCDQYNVYKVETVGDCYVAAVGVVTGQIMTGEEMDEDKVQSREQSNVCSLPSYVNTKDMLAFAKAIINISRVVIKPGLKSPALMRVGMHTGPCMSGIVGTKNLRYCLFGDSMNTAARMEQTGVVDAIHVSEVVADLVPDESWESRGSVTVKGKGLMETYVLRIGDVQLV